MSEPSARILLVDDDLPLANLLREFLELQGFDIALAHRAEDALEAVRQQPPDLVVLDVMLPGISGFEALRRLREHHDVPVIMLTARGEESERILGLMGGADDYLSKPCSPLELAVRIRTVLKRTRPPAASPTVQQGCVTVGPLTLDLRRREARAHGARVMLTPAELRVLEQLLSRPGEVLSRAELTQLALDRPIEAYDRSIDTLVSKLRRKLEAAGLPAGCIGGLRGHGYVLDPAALEQR
ncbi:MAG: response regulator transcription factor [Steroidobacteraceae bacterium]